MGDVRDGVLVTQEITCSGSPMLSPSAPAVHAKSGHTLRFDGSGGSELDLTDAEENTKTDRKDDDENMERVMRGDMESYAKSDL
ncbi:hypothetical protein FRC06_007324, partial [Ceratobasidium sp. 370]